MDYAKIISIPDKKQVGFQFYVKDPSFAWAEKSNKLAASVDWVNGTADALLPKKVDSLKNVKKLDIFTLNKCKEVPGWLGFNPPGDNELRRKFANIMRKEGGRYGVIEDDGFGPLPIRHRLPSRVIFGAQVPEEEINEDLKWLHLHKDRIQFDNPAKWEKGAFYISEDWRFVMNQNAAGDKDVVVYASNIPGWPNLKSNNEGWCRGCTNPKGQDSRCYTCPDTYFWDKNERGRWIKVEKPAYDLHTKFRR